MSLNPSEISSHIKNRDFQVAEDAIIQFIKFNVDENNQLVLAKPVSNHILQNIADKNKIENDTIEQLCNEYVTVITELFCHPQYKVSTNIITWFLTCKYVLDWLFSVSIWKNTDAIIEHLNLAQLDQFGQIKLNTNKHKLTLLLSLISLGSKFKLPWKLLFKANPAIALSSYIGLITQSIPALSEETNRGFNYLLESAKDIPILNLPVVTDLGKLNYGFFNCSYATSPNKYEFKKWLTLLIRHNLEQWLDVEVKEHTTNVKPLKIAGKIKIGVMLELYSKNHAMHRCYKAFLTGLAKHYELVAFIDKAEVSNADLSAFKQVVTFDEVFAINENAKRIIRSKPDILFYPSIGMKFWGIYLSQLRLAPLQVMMGGHPSSSFSPEIDYFMLLSNSFSINELQPYISEKLITTEYSAAKTAVNIQHQSLTSEFLTEYGVYLEKDDEIRIAINGIMTKVTYQIINICKQIQLQTQKKIIFVFFSGHSANQLAYLAAKKQLSGYLKNFELVSFSDYITYMKAISQCHFLLPTLPFGGSNSNIDAMVLKKPKLYIRGKHHVYTRTDQWEWERTGLDKELGCDSEEELIKKSLHLIENSNYRKKLYMKMTEKCEYDIIFNTKNIDVDFVSPLFEKLISQELNN